LVDVGPVVHHVCTEGLPVPLITPLCETRYFLLLSLAGSERSWLMYRPWGTSSLPFITTSLSNTILFAFKHTC
jgi:hypothetical protein